MTYKKLKDLFESQSFWAKGRKKKELKKMIKNSSCVITIWQGTRLIGFGRATSDTVYRAVLWDIVVEKKHQKYGIGKKIVQSLLLNRLISKVERIYIMTTICDKFYSKMGFKFEDNQKLMFLEK